MVSDRKFLQTDRQTSDIIIGVCVDIVIKEDEDVRDGLSEKRSRLESCSAIEIKENSDSWRFLSFIERHG